MVSARDKAMVKEVNFPAKVNAFMGGIELGLIRAQIYDCIGFSNIFFKEILKDR